MKTDFRSALSNVVVARSLTVFCAGVGLLEMLPVGGFRPVSLLLSLPLLLGAALLASFATIHVRGEEIRCQWIFWEKVLRMNEVREVRMEIPHLAGSLRLDRRVLPLGRLCFLLDGSDGPFLAETPMMRYLKERAGHGD